MKKIILPLLTGLLVFGLYQMVSGRVQTAAVECFTQFGPCPEHYLNDLNWISGTKLLKPLPQEKIEKSLQKYIEIKDVSVYRRLPQTMVVSVLLRKPVGTLGPQVLGVRYVADTDGLVMGESNSTALPFLVNTTQLKVGDYIPADRVAALEMMGMVGQLTRTPVSGQLNNRDLEIFLPMDQKVILNLDYPSPDWYATLQVVLKGSKIHSKIPKIIDLRFSDPIITF